MSSAVRSKTVEFDTAGDRWGVVFDARGFPAWAISLAFHLLLLFCFWQIQLQVFFDDNPVITSVIERELQPEDFKFETTLVDQVGAELDADRSDSMLEAASAARVEPAVQPKIEEPVEGRLLTVSAPSSAVLLPPDDTGLVDRIDAIGATEHAGGVEGAIDRLTYEIATSLKEQKTLVVWLLDASLSLKDRREAIADRIENVYRQLGVLKVGGEGALMSAVVSYGEKANLITPKPTDDVGKIVKAVRNVEPDTSGVENVFAAVSKAAQKWMNYRTRPRIRRNVMMIVVTDERGDDAAGMENVIDSLRRWGMRVYCVGNTAVFGRQKGYVRWVYEDGFSENLPVDQGPESVAPERLNLAYWGPSGRGLNQLSAGFGPYALTRLCAETGGMYFVADESGSFRFDPLVMRTYQPDYLTAADYEQQLRDNKAKGALVRAAMTTHAESVPRPKLSFRADNDTVLRRQLTEAQKPLAVLDHRLVEMQTILESGEPDRPNLTSPRWRAGFDLALGRVLAMRARSLGYNVLLAEMKRSPRTFRTKTNNTWRLVPARENVDDPRIKKLAEKARAYLTRVIDEHPSTPWQLLAERELSQPMGWQWKEAYREYPSLDRRQNQNPNRRRPQPARSNKPQKPSRQRTRPLL